MNVVSFENYQFLCIKANTHIEYMTKGCPNWKGCNKWCFIYFHYPTVFITPFLYFKITVRIWFGGGKDAHVIRLINREGVARWLTFLSILGRVI